MLSHVLALLGVAAVLSLLSKVFPVFPNSELTRLKTLRNVKIDAIHAFLLVVVSVPLTIAWVLMPKWLQFAEITHNWWLSLPSGLMILTLSTWLNFWAKYVLRSNWVGGAGLRENHQLIVEGPYKFIRNPMYVGFVGMAIGFGLTLNNWLVLVSYVVSYSLLTSRIPAEERLLNEEFGTEFEAYRSRAGRFFPRIRRRN